ncbi:MAG: response regulator [Bacteroidota bacterium]|nr:response regulator [Bacteroidota bacterium]
MKAILVDDEPRSSENLRILLEDHCPNVEVVAQCTDARESIQKIHTMKPDILFLDVEMPHVNGFDVLKAVRSSIRQVIFTTAHSKYAIGALREQAHDFLLKPVDPDELKRAVERLNFTASPGLLMESLERIEKLEQQFRKHLTSQIAIQTAEGYVLVNHSEIIRMEAESNYTHVHCLKKKYTVAKLLGYFQEHLPSGFIRVHSSHLVNLQHIKTYQRGDGGYVVMSDGVSVEVSRSRKKELMRVLLGEE